MTTPIVPPDLDDVRALLRPRMAEIPQILADWPRGDGPLADVPLLDPGMVAPARFESLAGTVRVAAASPSLVTVAAMLEMPDAGGLLVCAMTLNPHDLGEVPDAEGSRRVLAQEGADRDDVPVEVAALLSAIEPGGPAAGVGVVRPLLFADPATFPLQHDATDYTAELREAVRAAVAEDREVVTDLAANVLTPMAGDLARIWSPLFEVARAATAGLAARGAGQGS